MPTHEFKVEMTCEGCSSAIDKVLSKLKGKGVDTIEISLEKQSVIVGTSLTADEILNVIKKTGKNAAFVTTT